jgi:hypothetical protein
VELQLVDQKPTGERGLVLPRKGCKWDGKVDLGMLDLRPRQRESSCLICLVPSQ